MPVKHQPDNKNLTVITTHINADFDALASMLAAHKLYPDSLVVFPGSQEKNLRNFFIKSMVYLLNIANVKDIDFNKFSEHKSLYPYQREALQNATKIIYKFYDNFKDTEIAKKQFLKLNEQNGLNKDLQKRHFAYSDTESTAYNILSEFFEEEDYKLPAWNFINRMSFWMATGSGKSVVLIKLIELLQNLMKNEILPDNRILFLTHRPDLIEQLKEHIIEFNEYNKKEKGIEFIIRDLREFPEQEMYGNLFKDTQINIYFYRSDLISGN